MTKVYCTPCSKDVFTRTKAGKREKSYGAVMASSSALAHGKCDNCGKSLPDSPRYPNAEHGYPTFVGYTMVVS